MKTQFLAFVGMAGSGKSEATAYLTTKGIASVRFGSVTDEGLKAANIPMTPENEKTYREKLRAELGMAAYAIKTVPEINELLQTQSLVVIDGLYSWEEYKYLKQQYHDLTVVHMYAERRVRYERLAKRSIRPFTKEQSEQRDIAEIEHLEKAGPIAMADYLIDNTTETIAELHDHIEKLLQRIGIKR